MSIESHHITHQKKENIYITFIHVSNKTK